MVADRKGSVPRPSAGKGGAAWGLLLKPEGGSTGKREAFGNNLVFWRSGRSPGFESLQEKCLFIYLYLYLF